MKETLPPRVLKEKLPRFLQKCTKMFESDRRYRNDMRYLRVWLQLMDYVDDPRALLRSMEANGVGIKRSLFYQAYALYYEKTKKFEEAEKMYHLGVQNLAEPVNELQKSYEQFLQRAERHKKKMLQCQEGRITKRPLSEKDIPLHSSRNEGNSENACNIEGKPMKMLSENSQNVQSKHEVSENPCETARGSDFSTKKELDGCIWSRCTDKQQSTSGRGSNNSRMFSGEDTVVVKKFVDDAIVGKSEAKDACHHGLVDPTINLKEAMNAINNMFKEPLDPAPIKRRSHRSQYKDNHSSNNGFKVFQDEDLDGGIEFSMEEKSFPLRQQSTAQSHKPHQEPLKIFTDDEENEQDDFEQIDHLNPKDGSVSSALHLKAFVFPSPKDLSERSDELEAQSSPRRKLREDTVVRRFVGCTISDDPEAEDVCHHGLVDPTINLKEAMDDINNMFGKPIDFVRAKRPKKQFSSPNKNQGPCGFSILPDDDDLEQQSCQIAPKSSSNAIESDLREPTIFTKEAMDEINKMFGMPLDF
ncbi:probable inactive serine/threonine-protein kinase bub1 isoform X2 [Tripterygium wilfordii]|nr:probable inactive serine/threonine-protein kinase bub1 isoform X2 [Tripterygium wilfordii]